MRGAKPVFSDPEELEKKITSYFEKLNEIEPKPPPTMSGLALFLGVSRKTLTRYIESYESGEGKRGKGKAAECGELLMIAKAQIETYLEEQLLMRSKTHGIEFALQNGFGWGQKQTVDVKSDVKAEVKSEATPVSKLSDEELMEQIRILSARVDEIKAREGIDDADG